MAGTARLVASLLYGAGVRLHECLHECLDLRHESAIQLAVTEAGRKAGLTKRGDVSCAPSLVRDASARSGVRHPDGAASSCSHPRLSWRHAGVMLRFAHQDVVVQFDSSGEIGWLRVCPGCLLHD
jgi:hypothetical protein